MPTLESANIYGVQIRESANDGSDFSNAASDYRILFVGEDGLFHLKDSAGTVTTPASGSVATDAIWDAAGDLAVGTGANTAARLALGAAGGAVSRVNGAVAWNSGTAFPTAATGDRYWRTDLGMEFYHDGTRWLSTGVHTLQMLPRIGGTTSTGLGDFYSTIAATASGIVRSLAPSIIGGSNLYLVNYKVAFQVQGGTALSGSHKWVGTFLGLDSANASTGTQATVTIDSGSSSVNRESTIAIGAVQAAGTLAYMTSWTKTGTPGALQSSEALTYRIVAT